MADLSSAAVADCRVRLEQMWPDGIEILQALPQHVEVIEQPEALALHDDIVVLEGQIGDALR